MEDYKKIYWQNNLRLEEFEDMLANPEDDIDILVGM